MIKKLSFLAILIFSTSARPESLANDILKNDTINGIGGVKMILGAKGHKCQPQLLDAQVLQKPTNLKFQQGVPVSGYWKELWTVSCNQSNVIIPIKFVLNKTGASWVITPKEIKFK